MALGTVALVIAEYTPMFTWLSYPFIPLLRLLQIPEAILDLALQKGVLFYFCGNNCEVIRMIPPLTVTKEVIDTGLRALDEAITEYEQQKGYI